MCWKFFMLLLSSAQVFGKAKASANFYSNEYRIIECLWYVMCVWIGWRHDGIFQQRDVIVDYVSWQLAARRAVRRVWGVRLQQVLPPSVSRSQATRLRLERPLATAPPHQPVGNVRSWWRHRWTVMAAVSWGQGHLFWLVEQTRVWFLDWMLSERSFLLLEEQ